MSPVSRATLAGSGVGGTPITYYRQETEPTPQRAGDEWEQTSTGIVHIWNGIEWLELTGPPGEPGSDANVDGHEAAPDPHAQYTTTAEVDARIATVVDAAPAALDTLNEIAAALGDDADFAGTITTQLAGKADAGHGHPHNHDGAYAPTHNHPYASDSHNHDAAYAPTHGHPYAPTSHSHVDADLPAGLARDSEVAAAYSPLGHTHGAAAPAAHAATHASGGSDPITPAAIGAAISGHTHPADTAAHAVTASEHTATGLTTGHVLRATGTTTFAWQAITDADLPATIARDSEITTALSNHEAAANPHPTYATDTDLTNHVGAADPHTGYVLESAHGNSGDVHTQYQLESEKGAASGYASLDSGTKVPAAQLGTGTPDGTKFLRDDRTWAAPPAGGGGTPSDTVASEISFGVSAAAGSATAYARGDHTHGTPTNPVTAHEAASDPHTGYQLESEKNAANGYAGLDAATLVPRARLGTGTADTTTFLRGDGTWQTPAGGGGQQAPWRTKVHTLWGDGNPNQQDVFWSFQNTVVSVGVTPTNIGATVGRLVSFRYETAITVNTIRFFGIAAVANIYTAAIYSGTTRLWTATLNVAAGWNAIALGGSPITIPADTLCWFGVGANAVGTTAGLRAPASPVANSLGITTLPGNLANYINRFAQVALTAGAWPSTLPALAAAAFASAGTTGTVPIFFADNA